MWRGSLGWHTKVTARPTIGPAAGKKSLTSSRFTTVRPSKREICLRAVKNRRCGEAFQAKEFGSLERSANSGMYRSTVWIRRLRHDIPPGLSIIVEQRP